MGVGHIHASGALMPGGKKALERKLYSFRFNTTILLAAWFEYHKRTENKFSSLLSRAREDKEKNE